MSILFSGVDGTEVEFDEHDSLYPIRIADDWLEKGPALEVANAILAALGASAVTTNVVNTTTNGSGTLNEQLLAIAIANDLSVAFTYAKGDGQFLEERTLEPHDVNEVKGNKLVIGYDVDRDDVRAYRLDRIKGRVAIR